ncbi:hypothetical protein [Streptomyces sp. NPDC007369]|uniref:hypothetical protein n=1 Tax=Streptomyces sp. NPDC007369 TaxID=3154589 RepID=UPI0034077165
MGIESDQLVYAYLSRVGDLAQQRQMPSGDRMRLVAGLRDEIDRRRAKYEPETPDAVRGILERIGTPEDVLDGAGAGAGAAAGAVSAAHAAEAAKPRAGAGAGAGAVPAQRGPGRSRPAKGGAAGGDEPDWWRMPASPYGTGVRGGGPQVEGFTGGIEIPELFARPEDLGDAGEGAGAGAGGGAGAGAAPKQTLARFLRDRWRARKPAPAAEEAPAKDPAPAAAGAPRPKPHLFLLVAAGVLVAGAVAGSWLLLIGGWVLAYASRVLGPAERKAVVFGVPGAVFTGAVVWLWGRLEGRWGAPLTDEGLGGVFQGMWPWLARAAAVASAAYLVWRSRRR